MKRPNACIDREMLSELLSIMYDDSTASFSSLCSIQIFLIIYSVSQVADWWVTSANTHVRCLIPAGYKPQNGFGIEVSHVEWGNEKKSQLKFADYCCISEKKKKKRLCYTSPNQPVLTCQLKISTLAMIPPNCVPAVMRITRLLSRTSFCIPQRWIHPNIYWFKD